MLLTPNALLGWLLTSGISFNSQPNGHLPIFGHPRRVGSRNIYLRRSSLSCLSTLRCRLPLTLISSILSSGNGHRGSRPSPPRHTDALQQPLHHSLSACRCLTLQAGAFLLHRSTYSLILTTFLFFLAVPLFSSRTSRIGT